LSDRLSLSSVFQHAIYLASLVVIAVAKRKMRVSIMTVCRRWLSRYISCETGLVKLTLCDSVHPAQWRNEELGRPWTNIQVEPSLPFPYPLSPSATSLPLPSFSLPIPCYPFTSFPSLPSSPFLFPTLFSLSLPLITTKGLGERYIPQKVRAEPGRQTHCCAIYSPNSANLLKVLPTCTRRPVGNVAIKHYSF